MESTRISAKAASIIALQFHYFSLSPNSSVCSLPDLWLFQYSLSLSSPLGFFKSPPYFSLPLGVKLLSLKIVTSGLV